MQQVWVPCPAARIHATCLSNPNNPSTCLDSAVQALMRDIQAQGGDKGAAQAVKHLQAQEPGSSKLKL